MEVYEKKMVQRTINARFPRAIESGIDLNKYGTYAISCRLHEKLVTRAEMCACVSVCACLRAMMYVTISSHFSQ